MNYLLRGVAYWLCVAISSVMLALGLAAEGGPHLYVAGALYVFAVLIAAAEEKKATKPNGGKDE